MQGGECRVPCPVPTVPLDWAVSSSRPEARTLLDTHLVARMSSGLKKNAGEGRGHFFLSTLFRGLTFETHLTTLQFAKEISFNHKMPRAQSQGRPLTDGERERVTAGPPSEVPGFLPLPHPPALYGSLASVRGRGRRDPGQLGPQVVCLLPLRTVLARIQGRTRSCGSCSAA